MPKGISAMSHATFEDRLNRLNAKMSPAPEPSAPKTPRPAGPPHIALRALMFTLLFPIGIIASIATKAALDPEITPEAVLYVPLMITVAVFHALLLGGAAAALMTRLTRPILNRAVIYTLIGYGMMGAALNYAIT